MKTKAIIFDLGKVVFDVSFDKTFESWARSSGESVQQIKERFDFGELYQNFERSDITAENFRKLLSKQVGISIPDELFDEGWCELYLDVYNGIDPLLIGLKQTYKLVALTNSNEIHARIWKKKYYKTMRHFEKIFSSHEIKTRKPEKQSYGIVLDYLRLDPDETIFIDDNPENIKGAEKLGIKTILVESPVQMINDLTKLLNL